MVPKAIEETEEQRQVAKLVSVVGESTVMMLGAGSGVPDSVLRSSAQGSKLVACTAMRFRDCCMAKGYAVFHLQTW
eukprot:2932044-Amphidinium_carterae.1